MHPRNAVFALFAAAPLLSAVPLARAQEAAAPPTHHRIRLPAAPDAALRQALAEAGATLLDPLDQGVFYARLSAHADVDSLGALDAAVEPIDARDKVHPLFRAPEPPAWTVLAEDAQGESTVGAIVLFHRGVPLGAAAAEVLVRHGGRVATEFMSVNGVFAELPFGAIAGLAAEDAVMWIEPPLPRFEPWVARRNDSSRSRVSADDVQGPLYGLDGSGVTVFVFDGGAIRATHRDLVGRVTTLDRSGTNFHATHVAGTIGGTGEASGGQFKGMAPAVRFLSAGIEGSGVLLHMNPGDIEADYAAAFAEHGGAGRLITSNSLGVNVSANGLDCNLLGDYGTTSAIIDGMVRGSLGEPLIINWAGSNERGPVACGTTYRTVSPPATSKNPIIVGAINSNDDSMTDFSAWGPTDDGRLSPTVVAPGCQSDGDEGVTSTGDTSDANYITLCGTSMACPASAGVTALVLQDWRAQYPSFVDPENAMMKMIVAHSAVDLAPAGPDYMSGYGSIRATRAVEFLRTGNFASDAVSQGESFVLSVSVPPGTSTLKLTLVWDDAPGTPGAPVALVNDLDLHVTDPTGARHFPWTLNPARPSDPAVRTQEDHRNVVEQVLVDAPAAGTWTVAVVGTNVPEGPQRFALGSSVDLNLPSLHVFTPEGVPSTALPERETTFPVRIVALNDTVDPASAFLAARPAGSADPFTITPMTHAGGDDFSATIPATMCGPDLEIYLSASTTSGAEGTNPPLAPSAGTHVVRIGLFEARLDDDFQTDTGWTVVNAPELTDGGWERGVPQGAGLRADPSSDADGSGACWLTANRLGNSDVDGGPTVLTSPRLNAAADEAVLSYWRWFSTTTGANPLEDTLLVEISTDDGAAWTTLEEVGLQADDASGGWILAEHDLGALGALTDQLRVRFTVSDIGGPSIVEAGIDGFLLRAFRCTDLPACICDLDGNGADVFDLLPYLQSWFARAPEADIDGNAGVDVFDLLAFLECWFDGCA